MAEDDPFASIIDSCLYSSSQEDLLRHSKFAREDEIFSEDGGRSPELVDSDQSRMESEGAGVAGGSNQVGFAGARPDCKEKRVLGLPKEGKSSTIEVVFDGEVRIREALETESERGRVRERETPQEGSSIEPPLKKSRVSGSKLEGEKVSPLVQCSEKMVIDSEDKNKQIVIFRGGVRLEIVSPLRCAAPSGVECTEKLIVEDEHAAQDEMSREKLIPRKRKLEFDDNTELIEIQEEETNEPNREKLNPAKKKLEIEDNTEVIEIQDEETNEPKNNEMGNDVDKRDGNGNGKGTENRGDGSCEEIEGQGKRELPSSLLGQMWGLNPNWTEGTEDGGFGTYNKEGGERTGEGNGGHKSLTDETVRRLLDVLQMLATQMVCDADDGGIDILETAKKRGMTFPRSRFYIDLEHDE